MRSTTCSFVMAIAFSIVILSAAAYSDNAASSVVTSSDDSEEDRPEDVYEDHGQPSGHFDEYGDYILDEG